MKKYNSIKTIQMVVYIVIAIAALVIIFLNEDLYHLVANNLKIKIFFSLLWLLLVMSFIFLFIDFKAYAALKKEYSELNMAFFSDPITGIANRNSCDAIIEKYLYQPLPEEIGCITFDITNLNEVNKQFGHIEGNELIRDFSNILQAEAKNLCFVGRNGGNKFLAIFEDCTDEKMKNYLIEIERKIDVYNLKENNGKLMYKYGSAYNKEDNQETINQLIALSNRRAIEAYRTFVD